MTTLSTLEAGRQTNSESETAARSRRLVAVAIVDHQRDRGALEWAAAEVRPGIDDLHIVHAYLPLRLTGCTWEPVARARDARYGAANRAVAQAVQRVTAASNGLRVEGSAIAGPTQDVLEELSAVVDLLVIGHDGSRRDRSVAWEMQDGASCPVVSVPNDYRPAAGRRPVTVVADDRGIADAAMRFGAEAATRHNATLQVSRTWESLHEGVVPGSTWLAHQQETLDYYLAGWRLRYPHLAVVGRLELGTGWLEWLRSASSLVITGRDSAAVIRSSGRLPESACPTVVVPDTVAVPARPEPRGEQAAHGDSAAHEISSARHRA